MKYHAGMEIHAFHDPIPASVYMSRNNVKLLTAEDFMPPSEGGSKSLAVMK